ncbi:Helix-turn-helix domain-containing protein [Methylobacterium sp. UNCCL125]|nr:Helix-turn-helix domain-containing protein [Methylobacterium sp. UNCCL125]
MVLLGELLMILDLHRQGPSITAIARRTGRDPKTVRRYIARGLEPPAYGPRQAGRPSQLAPYLVYAKAMSVATGAVCEGLFVHMPVVGTIVEVGAVAEALAVTSGP